MELHVF